MRSHFCRKTIDIPTFLWLNDLYGRERRGTLVLPMGLRLDMENKEQPAAIVSFSPCTEQAEGLPSHTQNVETDYMLRDGTTRPEQYEAVFRPSFWRRLIRRCSRTIPAICIGN